VVHADGTGRLQTVDACSNPWMSALLSAFEAETGVPIVLNTSFNVMGKPIVHSVQDAMAVLATTGLDGVLLEDVLIEKPA
jgi:carbamoyltransferase